MISVMSERFIVSGHTHLEHSDTESLKDRLSGYNDDLEDDIEDGDRDTDAEENIQYGNFQEGYTGERDYEDEDGGLENSLVGSSSSSLSMCNSPSPDNEKQKLNVNSRFTDDAELLESFVTYDENGKCDASGIMSPECFAAWLSHQPTAPTDPKAAFNEAVVLHLSGSQGHRPFKKEVEKNLLDILRIGVLGYHEVQAEMQQLRIS